MVIRDDEINPCPYSTCKSSDSVTLMGNFLSSIFCVRCLSCGARGPNVRSRKRAIKQWNEILDRL